MSYVHDSITKELADATHRIAELEAEIKVINSPRGYVRNCLIHTGELGETGALFYKEKGIVTCELDGYAIIPIEEYEELEAENQKLQEELKRLREEISHY